MAGNNYNPNSPSTVGEEWLANLYGTWDVAAQGAWAQRIRSRAAETINRLGVWMVTPFSPIAPNNGRDIVLMEIIPAGSEIPSGTVSTFTYAPSADTTVTNWVNQAASAVNIFNVIDEGVATPNIADYIVSTNPGSDLYRCRFASGGFSATARVLGLQFRLALVSPPFSGGANLTVQLYHIPSTTAYLPSSPYVSIPADGQTKTITITLGDINPNTGLPWTPADIIAFSSGTWALQVQQAANGLNSLRIVAAELQVIAQSVENRVAAATWVASAGLTYSANIFQYSNAFVALPGAGASWAKPLSGDFTVLLRRPVDASIIWGVSGTPHNPVFPWLSAQVASVETASAVPGVASAIPVLDAYGQVTSIDFTSATRGRTIPLIVSTSAPTTSQDSLPYYLTNDLTHMPGINNAQTVTQQFTAPASATFDFIRLELKPGLASQAVLIKVKRVSDNVQFGNTITVTAAAAAALAAQGNGFVIFATTGVGAVLVSGTRYYIELTSADSTTLGLGWQTVLIGDASMGGGTGSSLATFGGATDTALVAGVAKTELDMPFALAQLPATPAGLAVAVQNVVPASFKVAQGCGIPTVQAVRVSWTATALGATWTRYEVQRTENGGTTWKDIAWGTSAEANVIFTDYESPRGVNVQYRIRVVRSDGAISNYTAASAGVTCQPYGCEMIFVSNESQSLVVAYNREPELKYGFIAPQRDQFWEIYGADYAVAFMESEDPGIAVGALLTVNFATLPPVDDVTVFSPLRSMCRAPVSYVCVLDFSGSRFFAHVQFPTGTWTEPGYNYHADVMITEITGTPSVATF